MSRSWCLLAVLAVCWAGCAGYRLGPSNGEVAGAKSIRVDLFKNETYEPRLPQPVATALRRSLQQDGTYRLSTRGDPDIVLTGVITRYQRVGISFAQTDVITPTDFEITMIAKVTATERRTGRVLLDREVRGRATVLGGPDLSSAEREAVPQMAQDLAWNLTSLLADGTW